MTGTYKQWSERGVVTNYDEDINNRIGKRRGYHYGNTGHKHMTGTASAIISTLHAAGPDLTLRAKDMVNDVTRRGYAFDIGKMNQRQVPLRGQTSCGEDEFEGTLLTIYELTVPDDIDLLTNAYGGWHRAVDDEGEYTNFKEVRVVSSNEGTAYARTNRLVNEHIAAYVEELKADYMTDTDWSDKGRNETTTRDECLDWMLQRWDWNQWVGLLSYRIKDTNTYYKGECAWENQEHEGVQCAHHYGTVYENVIQYTFDGRPYTTETEWHYLDEYEGDESELLKSLVDDEDVLARIKREIPKMKTSSRNWIHAPTTRGHYSLTWWPWIQREAARKLEHDAKVAQVEQDQVRDGFEINGWKFVAGNVSTRYGRRGDVTPSKWHPIEPVYNYEVLNQFIFRSKAHAEDFVASILDHRHMMVGRKMDKGGALVGPLDIDRRVVYLSLFRDADPTVLTPEQVVSICYTNGTFPEDYPFSSNTLCTFADEEE